jgi:hypothetical protein
MGDKITRLAAFFLIASRLKTASKVTWMLKACSLVHNGN